MTTVRIVDGMKYGFKLLGIFIAVSLVCGAFIAGGAVIYQDAQTMSAATNQYYGRMVAAGLMTLVGGLGLYGSIVSFTHKFIADSVIAGLETADLEVAGAKQTVAQTAVAAGDADESADDTSAEPTDDTTEKSTAGSTSDEPDEENTEDQASNEEGVFGIDTSKTRAEPSGPRTREPDEQPMEQSGQAESHEEPSQPAPEASTTSPTQRASSPDQRSWKQDEPTEASGDPGPTQDESGSESDAGYPDSLTAGPSDDDWDQSEEEQVEETTAESGTESTDVDANGESEEPLWTDDEENPRKNIDQVVSEATRPDADPAGGEESVGEPMGGSDGGTLETEPDAGPGETNDEPQTIDDAPGEFVAKPPADATDTDDVDAEEESVDPADKLPDEPITDDDIEDTTDEEGDWEPLDESDL